MLLTSAWVYGDLLSFLSLTTWSPVGKTAWEELGGVDLLEKVCH